jgi:hypothetical protein
LAARFGREWMSLGAYLCLDPGILMSCSLLPTLCKLIANENGYTVHT